MCGFLGVIRTNHSTELQSLSNDLSFLNFDVGRKRGFTTKSQSTHFNDLHLILLHSLLNINDSDTVQPISVGNKYKAVFNGQIFNVDYLVDRFSLDCHSGDDTAVIAELLNTYGVDCLAYLDGMFSIAIVDCVSKKLHLARDFHGHKPLFYSCSENNIVFGSSLRDVSRTTQVKSLNYDYIAESAFFGFPPSSNTIYNSISSIPSGTLVTIDINRVIDCEIKSELIPFKNMYHEPYNISTDKHIIFSALAHTNHDFVLNQSSGVDSSTLFSLLLEKNIPFSTCTTRFVDVPSNYNFEHDFAKQLSQDHGVVHHSIDITAEDFSRSVLSSFSMIEEINSNNSTPMYDLVAQYHSTKGNKVVLSGDGGDEIYLGYSYFFPTIRQKLAIASGYDILKKYKFSGYSLGLWNRISDISRYTRLYMYSRAYLCDEFLQLERMSISQLFNDIAEKGFVYSQKCIPIPKQRLLPFFEAKYWLSRENLTRSDNLYANRCVELRSPFLGGQLFRSKLLEPKSQTPLDHSKKSLKTLMSPSVLAFLIIIIQLI